MLSHKQLFLLNTAQTSDFPRLLEIEKAEGCYLIDPTGRKYLDLVSGFAVSNLGHRHPNVIEAIKKQLDKYLHVTVYGEYIQAPQVLFAQKLSSVLPKNLSSVYFTNSGAEATEGALKLAKKFTNRSQIISFHHAYHGSTHGALSVMGNEYYKQAYRPLLPDIHFINLNNKQQLDDITSNTAAVILEAIQGEAGVRVPDADYLKALRTKCNETGAVLIFDEIQTGFGRTGKLFAFEHFDVIPDILLLAKGMGGGMPIGAFIASKKMMDVFKDNPILGHITTFGGHPVSCAAGLATLETILAEDLMSPVEEKEKLFRTLLKHPKIKEIRGKGLMLSIQLDNFKQVEAVSKTCVENGVIIDWFLHCDNAMRIAPPLIITLDEIKFACKVILGAISAH
ncbi:MAG: aspartate aminotransferase family protein [Bacteroidetes bacterium]|nr:aspartate aminotransferase family protein [Bacteroidota bacterium]MBU1374044.1 aspartate aminotransferase family protein [Bacteroidota bacterium]MBU1484616.1 aspartate aminotransferase family protein [Bacteroidota bacterium]MBU1761399.1 aspartate aminotransferase family protein [Bacteroidota bacterium]MBU2268769.1 aspartate aminotransferase family protein [Bacteroidota bacterium]